MNDKIQFPDRGTPTPPEQTQPLLSLNKPIDINSNKIYSQKLINNTYRLCSAYPATLCFP